MRQDGIRTVTYKTPGTGRRALLCLVLGGAILFFAFRLQAVRGFPLPFLRVPSGTATEKAEGGRREQELSLSAHTLYALQLGAFTQESAALQLAQQFIARGAAGYVHFDGSAYRVLAAAYPTRAEAQAVQTRLGNQNISTYIHPCALDALTLRMAGTPAQVQSLSDALDYLDALGEKLYALSASLDGRAMGAEDVRSALLSEGVTCAGLQQKLLAAFDQSLPASLLPVEDLLSQVADAAEGIRNENSTARIGAALKRCHLTVFFGLSDFSGHLQ